MASHEENILIYLYYTTAFVTEQAHRENRLNRTPIDTGDGSSVTVPGAAGK